jgi:predicted DNA-binding transcriptional regulator YafY
MRAERLLRIVMLLQTRGRVTAGELARELEISTRTVKRDMEALSGAGIPVYATRGGAGGWRLVESYRTSLTGLTTTEALSIVVGHTHGVLADLGLDDPGEGPILKLLETIAPSARARVDHARERIHVHDGPWGGRVTPPDPTLVLLQKAIWADRVVRVLYGTSPRSVRLRPYGLVRQGSWYLVARRGSELRTYRVSRIHRLELTDETFERPPGFDLAGHWQEASRSFVASHPRYVVELRLRGEAAIRAGWVWARERTVGEPDADGWVRVTLDLQDAETARTTVRQLGTDTVVLAPAELREATLAYARQLLDANS